MKVGLIARCDDRGLGNLTWEFHRNLQPDRTLVVDMGARRGGFAQHLDRYGEDATVLTWAADCTLPEDPVRRWLQGLDVVYSAETFYDWRIIEWARELGVATVLAPMPEFWNEHLPHPTALWAPTPWRIDLLPDGTRLVPIPVAADRWDGASTYRPDGAPLRILHVAGHRAAGDRNGTNLLLAALRRVRSRVEVNITTQDGRLPSFRPPRNVRLATATRGSADYWALYPGHDLLVMPRRYGGLCLPAQEAMGAGLGLVMPSCEPNWWWPAVTTNATEHGSIACPAGQVPTWLADPVHLAAVIDGLAAGSEVLQHAQAGARTWVRNHSWDALAPMYRAELAAACS